MVPFVTKKKNKPTNQTDTKRRFSQTGAADRHISYTPAPSPPHTLPGGTTTGGGGGNKKESIESKKQQLLPVAGDRDRAEAETSNGGEGVSSPTSAGSRHRRCRKSL